MMTLFYILLIFIRTCWMSAVKEQSNPRRVPARPVGEKMLVEARHEGPAFFGKSSPWKEGYGSFRISPAYPHYNDYISDLSLGTRYHTIDLERFREHFAICDESLKKFKDLVLPETGNTCGTHQPAIYMRPYVEQVLDLSVFLLTGIGEYSMQSLGRNMMQLRWGYFELSKNVKSPDSWLVFDVEAQSKLLGDLQLEVKKTEGELGKERNKMKEVNREILALQTAKTDASKMKIQLQEELRQSEIELTAVTQELHRTKTEGESAHEFLVKSKQHQETKAKMDQLAVEKQAAEQKCLVLNRKVKDLEQEMAMYIREEQAVTGVLGETSIKSLSQGNLKNVIINWMTTDHFDSKFGIPPVVLNSCMLAVVVIVLLILLIIWKSRKQECTSTTSTNNIQEESLETTENFGIVQEGDMEAFDDRPASPPSHHLVEIDYGIEEDIADYSEDYAEPAVQYRVRPISCRAKPAMFVQDDY